MSHPANPRAPRRTAPGRREWSGAVATAPRPRERPAGPPARGSIRVALIDEDPRLRDRLATLLERQPGLRVVAREPSAASGVFRAREAQPDVLVVNAALGPDDSHLCVRRARELLPGARVVVMNAPPVGEEIVAFIREGTDGLIHREATLDEFVGAIHTVAEGHNVLPDPLAPPLFAHLADQADGTVPLHDPGPDTGLTEREGEVVALIAGGYSNKSIALQLGVALHTVKSHVHHALEKLELSSRLQLAARARAEGWVARRG